MTMENSKLYVEIADNGTLRVTDKISGRVFDKLHYFEDCSDKGGPLRFDPAYESGLTTSLTQRPEIALITNGELSATYRITYTWSFRSRFALIFIFMCLTEASGLIKVCSGVVTREKQLLFALM